MPDVQAVWLRASLPLCLLGLLATEGESYGYALIQRLGEAGLGGLKAATLYPALGRLEEEGAVEVRWSAGDGGPGRKYYRLTPAGHSRLAQEYRSWRALDDVVSALAGGRSPATTAPANQESERR
ncbi:MULTISPECIES: PadR family transcriptional regulator [unclassified Streptomyces]|uniref:PadR family transcriptional regulator n=1 Tax=unclassified Streptomyces TaxID=2593676 RepID=UPI0033C145E3